MNRSIKIITFLLAVSPVFISLEYPFFWDTIQLSSKHAHHFFDKQFTDFFLPLEMDSGHFPLMGMYLAVLWTLFGKSLIISHLAMLPFILGTCFYLWRIGEFFLKKQYAFILVLVTLVDPVFAGQSVLVSPDVAVMCVFLMGLDSVLRYKNWGLGIAAILLAALSMRGMMIVLSLYFFSLLLQMIVEEKLPKKNFTAWFIFLWRKALPFIPSGLLSVLFLFLHYQHTGWIGYHEDSPWASAFVKVDFAGFLKNCAVYVWRILDYGRFFLLAFAFLFFGISYNRIVKNGSPRKLRITISIVLTTAICLSPSVLIHKGLLLHRYLLPILFSLNLLAIYILVNYGNRYKHILIFLAFIGLGTGNFWIYPKQIAQGWDATLAHVPYYELRAEMITYLENEKIPYKEVGSAFPNISGFKYTDLQKKNSDFVPFDLEQNRYILYSNVMNDFSDEQLADLENNWIIKQQNKSGGVCFILYEKPPN